MILITALLFSALAFSAPGLAAPSVDGAQMEYVSACDAKNTCRKFSRLIMGTDHLIQGGWVTGAQAQIPEEQAFAILDEAAKHGINLFDTSPVYVNSVENTLGKWLKSRRPELVKTGFYSDPRLNPDRKLYTLTKGGFPFDLYYAKNLPPGELSPELKAALGEQKIIPPGTYASRLYGSSPQIAKRISEELGHSMDNLEDQITIYLMHRDDGDFLRFDPIKREQTPVRVIMEALGTPELSKHYSHLGWSNWKTDRVNESLRLAAADATLPKPQFNSAYFSLFEMSPRTIHAGGVQVTHREMMEPAFQKGILQNPYSPLGGFSILDKDAPSWENARKSAQLKYEQGDAYWRNVYHAIFTDENKARYDRVVKFTEEFNRAMGTAYSVDQMVNAYALAHKRMDFLTVGPITVEEVRRTVGSLGLSRLLTEEDLNFLHSGTLPPRSQCLRSGILRFLYSPAVVR